MSMFAVTNYLNVSSGARCTTVGRQQGLGSMSSTKTKPGWAAMDSSIQVKQSLDQCAHRASLKGFQHWSQIHQDNESTCFPSGLEVLSETYKEVKDHTKKGTQPQLQKITERCQSIADCFNAKWKYTLSPLKCHNYDPKWPPIWIWNNETCYKKQSKVNS